MVVIQESKTCVLRSRLHLPHSLGEVKPKGNFCHINHVNINGVNGNGGKEHTLNSYTSKTACCLFVTEETDGVDLSVP